MRGTRLVVTSSCGTFMSRMLGLSPSTRIYKSDHAGYWFDYTEYRVMSENFSRFVF
jgi:hypothetical protein